MRHLFFTLLLILSFTIQAQAVTVMLTAKYHGIPLLLDSIILENLTQPNRVVLAPLPQITSYQIDLKKGKIINAIPEYFGAFGIYFFRNQPGFQQVLATLSQKETLTFRLIDLSGKQMLQKSIECDIGSNLIEIHTGKEPVSILNIQGELTIASFTLIGGKGETPAIKLKEYHDFDYNKREPLFVKQTSSTDFIFTPGDIVRFTSIKNGMYPNAFLSKPVDKDSITIFLSMPCPNTPVVNDYDGNLYHTVLIGSQCWMRENMRTTHYSNGDPLVNGTGVGSISGDYFTKYWFDYNDDPSNSLIYGKLYNGPAVLNLPYNPNGYPEKILGVCPVGWHVSSDRDWIIMEVYLGMGADTTFISSWRGLDTGSKLKETDTIHWTIVNNYATNESGFSGIGSGARSSSGPYSSLRSTGLWWALLNTNYFPFFDRKLTNLMPSVYRGIGDADFGYSCRCVKD